MPDPVALHIGHLTIRWYGIFVAAGFLAAYHLAQRRSRALGLGEETAGNLTLVAMIGGIVGARLLYVITFWSTEFAEHPLDAFKIWQGGLVFYGGFIGAVLLTIFWSRRKKLPLALVGDMTAPALPLGHAFGRIGCFLNGCCFGQPYHGPGAIHYPGITADGFINGPLHVQRQLGLLAPDATACTSVFPIQLVASLGNAAICAILLWFSDKPTLRGRLFPLYLMLYAGMRFMVEFGRGDYLTRYHGLTSAQLFCLLLFPAGALWFMLGQASADVHLPESGTTGKTT